MAQRDWDRPRPIQGCGGEKTPTAKRGTLLTQKRTVAAGKDDPSRLDGHPLDKKRVAAARTLPPMQSSRDAGRLCSKSRRPPPGHKWARDRGRQGRTLVRRPSADAPIDRATSAGGRVRPGLVGPTGPSAWLSEAWRATPRWVSSRRLQL